ncbi:MAG: hypothetical protein LBN37_02890, partial [Bacteroidales bacterium]|nr:hypothetical protein [Bacteroidales bacterium]
NITAIQDKLRKAGFTHVKAAYTYGFPGHISWLLSMKYPLRLLNISKLFILLLPIYYLTVILPCLLLNQCDVCARHSSGTGLKVKAVK